MEKVSNYQLLTGLSQDNKYSNSISYFKSKVHLSKFKLFGFILYEKSVSPDFHEEYLLCTELFDELMHNNFFNLEIVNQSVKNNSDLYALCQILELDYKDLPVIVLSEKLDSNNYHVIRSGCNNLRSQLNEINQYCEGQKNRFSIFNKYYFNKLIKNLCSPLLSLRVYLDNKLSERLSDFFALYEIRNAKNENEISNMASSQIEDKILTNLFYNRSNHSKNTNDGYLIFFLHCISNLSINIKQSFDSFNDRDNNFKPFFINRSFYRQNVLTDSILSKDHHSIENLLEKYIDHRFESESKIIFKTFISAQNFFISNNDLLDAIDYSIFLLPLCKIFEIETNSSIVQWIRKEIEIEMPRYYNLYKSTNGHQYKILPSQDLVLSPKSIDFNRKVNGKWIAPPIGQSELIAKTFYLKNNTPPEISDFSKLLECWKTFRENRNEGAHTLVKYKLHYDDVVKTFFTMCQSNLFSEMNTLKHKLKN